MCICAHCLVLKDIYSVSACKRSSKLISSGLLINTLCSMEYLINAHTLMLLSSPCLSWMHMGDGRMTAGSLGFRLLTQVSSRWWAEDGPSDCYGPSSHVVTVDTVGDVAAAAPPDYCFHWSVGARPSARHHCWSFFGSPINPKAHRRTPVHQIKCASQWCPESPDWIAAWFLSEIVFSIQLHLSSALENTSSSLLIYG